MRRDYVGFLERVKAELVEELKASEQCHSYSSGKRVFPNCTSLVSRLLQLGR